MAAETSDAVPGERLIQRRALLHQLGLATSHYLKLQTSAGAGAGQQHPAPGALQSPQVAIRQLLNTACICLMPDHLAYHWWAAPSAVGHSSPLQQPQKLHEDAVAAAGHLPVPGEVQVKGICAPRQHQSGGISAAQSSSPHPTLALQGEGDGGATEGPRPLQKASAGAQTTLALQGEGETAPRVSEGAQQGAKRAPEGARKASESAQKAPKGAQGAAQVHAERHEMQESAPASPKGSDGGPFGCSPVHIQLQVLHSLRHLLTSKLEAIAGGSAEEDRSLAQQPGCSHAACMALGYRAGQKQIATAALHAVTSTAAEVVQRAMAGSGLGASQPTNLEEVGQLLAFLLTDTADHERVCVAVWNLSARSAACPLQ